MSCHIKRRKITIKILGTLCDSDINLKKLFYIVYILIRIYLALYPIRNSYQKSGRHCCIQSKSVVRKVADDVLSNQK
jgi:hypothetical protein